MQNLSGAVREAGEDWSPSVPCVDRNGKHYTAEYAPKGFRRDEQLYTYGDRDRAPIPPGSTLLFEIELIALPAEG